MGSCAVSAVGDDELGREIFSQLDQRHMNYRTA